MYGAVQYSIIQYNKKLLLIMMMTTTITTSSNHACCNTSYKAHQKLRWATVATIDMGRKQEGCCVPFAGNWDPSNTMWPRPHCIRLPYQVASSSIQPFGYNRHEAKTVLLLGELRPHLTHRRLGRGLPPYQVPS